MPADRSGVRSGQLALDRFSEWKLDSLVGQNLVGVLQHTHA